MVRCVEDRPKNAGSERLWALVNGLNEVEVRDTVEWHTEDFVRQDRRRLVALPEVDRHGFIEQILAWSELEDGKPIYTPLVVLGVAGDRCVAMRIRIGFATGNGVDLIHVVCFDRLVERMHRIVSFDPDDVDAALAELERLHGEIEADRV
mgnify:CR=1 FL=1